MPKSPRPDHVLVFSVFVVASSGLAYELVSAALASYLLGDSVLQFSTVIGCYLFAMGVGSHLSRYVRDADLLRVFIEVELMIALVGGLSATLLFVLFGAQGLPFRTLLYALVFAIGVFVGSEIPLVMRLLDARKAETRLALGDMLSRVLTFDYLGALLVSLLFPLVLAPWLGMARTALLFGLLNAAVALYTLHAFRDALPRRRGVLLRALFVLAVLVAAVAASPSLTGWSERRLYGDDIIHAQTSPYQRIVLTRWRDDLRLYLNGELQFSTRDEYRYHEALVHPALQDSGARSVLVLGGGDGLALREVLKHASVREVTVVDLDPAVTTLFAQHPELVALNRGALADARVRIVNADAGRWLETDPRRFDAIFIDLPDPTNFALGKLYSVPFYRLLARHLNDDGLVAIQATSPYYAPHAYWCVEASLRAAGLTTWPYHVNVPSFGDWGFVLAGHAARRYTPPQRYDVPVRYLDAATTAALFRFAPDLPRPEVEPNHLDTQALVRYYEKDWRNVVR
ncbi:MAG TPA: polyamine aminopropyltransferase [Tahibacter sp.]|uniref:polyamine aminopropyltransferase n=1 Tax=Tahibacter sp. TaxID=2056211 RepID=UPI002CCC7836|nr:polyamine aminopropyltransferase [Tahibacter sp.]HSX62189.1 polyamine aminopropyltransferase [Tahibacter sp.]